MRSKKLWLLLYLFVILGFGREAGAGKVYFSLVTGSIGGTYYPIGNALAGVINKYVPEVYIIVESGNASVANCLLLDRKEVEMAFVQSDVLNWAFRGVYVFNKPITNIRAFSSLYPETLHIVVSKRSGINNIYGLKGKRVAVGEVGSGTEINARILLEEAGLSYKDMEVNYLESSVAVQYMKEGKLDAFFYTVGFPASVIEELAKNQEIRILSLGKDFIRKVREKHPWFVPDLIPPKTYKNQEEAVETLSVMAVWVGLSTISADLVYKMVKAFFEHLEEVRFVHPKARSINLDSAISGINVPLHEGAERFYKEKGLLQ